MLLRLLSMSSNCGSVSRARIVPSPFPPPSPHTHSYTPPQDSFFVPPKFLLPYIGCAYSCSSDPRPVRSGPKGLRPPGWGSPSSKHTHKRSSHKTNKLIGMAGYGVKTLIKSTSLALISQSTADVDSKCCDDELWRGCNSQANSRAGFQPRTSLSVGLPHD